jgi:hypothetical protein
VSVTRSHTLAEKNLGKEAGGQQQYDGNHHYYHLLGNLEKEYDTLE